MPPLWEKLVFPRSCFRKEPIKGSKPLIVGLIRGASRQLAELLRAVAAFDGGS
jgi:hypothetical protein